MFQIVVGEDAIKIECVDIQDLENLEKNDMDLHNELEPSHLMNSGETSVNPLNFSNDHSGGYDYMAIPGSSKLNKVSYNFFFIIYFLVSHLSSYFPKIVFLYHNCYI